MTDPDLDPDLARAPYLPCERCGQAGGDVMYDSLTKLYLCHACYLEANFRRSQGDDDRPPPS